MKDGPRLPGLDGLVDSFPPRDVTIDELHEHQRRMVCEEPPDNSRARVYQDALDAWYPAFLAEFKEADKEQQAGYGWPASVLAFCHFSPLSRYHGNEEALELSLSAFKASVESSFRSLREMPEDVRFGWGGGQGIGLIAPCIRFESLIDDDIKEKAIRTVEMGAERYVGGTLPQGNVGNQVSARSLGELNAAVFLKRQDYLDIARKTWEWHFPKAITGDAQVIEQYAPCHHYSYNSYRMLWPYRMLANSDALDEVFLSAIEWFRRVHLPNGYNFPGVTARDHRETAGSEFLLMPILEFFAPRQPLYQPWADQLREVSTGRVYGWVAETMIQAMMNTRENIQPAADHAEDWKAPFVRYFDSVYFHRSPVKYAIVHQNYSTMDLIEGWVPVKGIQSWAWGDEPPVIHPSVTVRSSTVALGIDTAAHSVSHIPPKGTLLFAPDASFSGFDRNTVPWDCSDAERTRLPRQYLENCFDWRWWGLPEDDDKSEDAVPCITKRNEKLITTEVFTPFSTVIIHTGETGPRTTEWALNRNDPTEPVIGEGVVHFKDRTPKLYSYNSNPPEISVRDPGDEKGDITVLRFESREGSTAFAFSNDSFEFLSTDIDEEGVLEFRDESGTYRVNFTTSDDCKKDPMKSVPPSVVTKQVAVP